MVHVKTLFVYLYSSWGCWISITIRTFITLRRLTNLSLSMPRQIIFGGELRCTYITYILHKLLLSYLFPRFFFNERGASGRKFTIKIYTLRLNSSHYKGSGGRKSAPGGRKWEQIVSHGETYLGRLPKFFRFFRFFVFDKILNSTS